MISKLISYDIPDNLCKQIDKEITKYPKTRKKSALLFTLKLIQENVGGWLQQAHLIATANYLQIPVIAVYEVATFYSMLKLSPVGKNIINICNNISCQLKGSDELIEHAKQKLKINLKETTKDELITLDKTECIGACIYAPTMLVNGKYHEKVTKEKLISLIDNIQEGSNE